RGGREAPAERVHSPGGPTSVSAGRVAHLPTGLDVPTSLNLRVAPILEPGGHGGPPSRRAASPPHRDGHFPVRRTTPRVALLCKVRPHPAGAVAERLPRSRSLTWRADLRVGRARRSPANGA